MDPSPNPLEATAPGALPENVEPNPELGADPKDVLVPEPPKTEEDCVEGAVFEPPNIDCAVVLGVPKAELAPNTFLLAFAVLDGAPSPLKNPPEFPPKTLFAAEVVAAVVVGVANAVGFPPKTDGEPDQTKFILLVILLTSMPNM